MPHVLNAHDCQYFNSEMRKPENMIILRVEAKQMLLLQIIKFLLEIIKSLKFKDLFLRFCVGLHIIARSGDNICCGFP